MSSGMNLEQAIEYAKTMTYRQAVSNIGSGKFIKYRKATMVKLRELAEIADTIDEQNCVVVPREDVERKRGGVMNSKKYVLPDNTEIHFAYDQTGVGKITLECMDILVGLIKNSNKVQQELQQDTNCTE